MRSLVPSLLRIVSLGLVAALVAVACGDVDRASTVPFEPPLLIDRETSGIVPTLSGPHQLPFDVQETFVSGGFVGVTFDSVGDAVLLSLEAHDAAVQRPVLALYGPRSDTGVWGQAVATNTGSAGAATLDAGWLEAGRYLALVGVASGEAQGVFTLHGECVGGVCTQATDLPDCELQPECSLVCPLGFEVDDVGCPLCACVHECETEFDCPEGMICDADFVCAEACQCNQPLDPVCGVDGETYANACEAGCAGVPVVAIGECSAECPALDCALDCPDGFAVDEVGCPVCACLSACDSCGGTWAPVCTANNKTFVNLCEAECAGERLAYLGACRSECPSPACALSCEAGYELDADGCPLCQCAVPTDCAESGRVCVTNGATLVDRCAASDADLSVVYDGTCPAYTCATDAGCPANTVCVAPPVDAACLLSSAGLTDTCLGVCVRFQTCTTTTNGDPSTPCPVGYECVDGACVSSCLCSAKYDPVCGADGVTYDNACAAGCAGAVVARVGRCCQPLDACELACPSGFAVDSNGCATCACAEKTLCACSEFTSPVCVTTPDGSALTYLNRCWAECDGFRNSVDGACE